MRGKTTLNNSHCECRDKQLLIGLLQKADASEEERRSNVAVIGNLLNNERGALYLSKNDIIRHDMMI